MPFPVRAEPVGAPAGGPDSCRRTWDERNAESANVALNLSCRGSVKRHSIGVRIPVFCHQLISARGDKSHPQHRPISLQLAGDQWFPALSPIRRGGTSHAQLCEAARPVAWACTVCVRRAGRPTC